MEYPLVSVDVHRVSRHVVPVSSREQPPTLAACGPGVARRMIFVLTLNLLRPEEPGQWCLIDFSVRMASTPCAGRDRGHHVAHDRRWAVGVGVAVTGGGAAAAGGAGAGGCAAG